MRPSHPTAAGHPLGRSAAGGRRAAAGRARRPDPGLDHGRSLDRMDTDAMNEVTDRQVLLEWIADEFLHNSRVGRRLVAGGGASPAHAARVADEIAPVLAERGQNLTRVDTCKSCC